MRDFATSGPAFAQLEQTGPIDWAAWHETADRLHETLAGAPDLDRRIHHLYLPALFFCLAQLTRAQSRPLVAGVQAPQGGGKTTLVTHLLGLLPGLGLRGAGVSIDDFYLRREEQLRLAAAHPGNPYLEHRGYPGTHDVALGAETIAALKQLGAGSSTPPVRVPVYDKSLHGGRGDRRPEAEWRAVGGPLDLVIVEGWMLGFEPVPETVLTDRRLVEPNRQLARYSRWHELLDAMVVLRAIDPSFVVDWRVQAEAAMTARGLPGLDRAAIEDYIRRFLPAYALYATGASGAPRVPTLEIWLDAERQATSPPST